MEGADSNILVVPKLLSVVNNEVADLVASSCRKFLPTDCAVTGVVSQAGSIVTQVTLSVPERSAAAVERMVSEDLRGSIVAGLARFLVGGTVISVTQVFPITKAIQVRYATALATVAPTAQARQDLTTAFALAYTGALFLDSSMGSLSVAGDAGGFVVSLSLDIADLSTFSQFEGLRALAAKAVASGELDLTFRQEALKALPYVTGGPATALATASTRAAAAPPTTTGAGSNEGSSDESDDEEESAVMFVIIALVAFITFLLMAAVIIMLYKSSIEAEGQALGGKAARRIGELHDPTVEPNMVYVCLSVGLPA